MAWHDNIPTFWQEDPGRQQFLKDKAFPVEVKACKHINVVSPNPNSKQATCLNCGQEFEVITPYVLKPIEVEYVMLDIQPPQSKQA